MPTRKRSRRSSSNRRRRQEQSGPGELPFVRENTDAAATKMEKLTEYVGRTEYSEMIEDIATLARRNPAATLALGIAAGLLTVQLARRLPRGESEQNGTAGRRSQKQYG